MRQHVWLRPVRAGIGLCWRALYFPYLIRARDDTGVLRLLLLARFNDLLREVLGCRFADIQRDPISALILHLIPLLRWRRWRLKQELAVVFPAGKRVSRITRTWPSGVSVDHVLYFVYSHFCLYELTAQRVLFRCQRSNKFAAAVLEIVRWPRHNLGRLQQKWVRVVIPIATHPRRIKTRIFANQSVDFVS